MDREHLRGSGSGKKKSKEKEPEKKRQPLATWNMTTGAKVSINVAVWANIISGSNGDFEKLSMTIKRRYYKEKDDEWVEGGSFEVHEIPILKALMDQAFVFMLERKMNHSE